MNGGLSLPFGVRVPVPLASSPVSKRPCLFLPVGGRCVGGELLPSLAKSFDEGGRWCANEAASVEEGLRSAVPYRKREP